VAEAAVVGLGVSQNVVVQAALAGAAGEGWRLGLGGVAQRKQAGGQGAAAAAAWKTGSWQWVVLALVAAGLWRKLEAV
jgi:hypothetical protein